MFARRTLPDLDGLAVFTWGRGEDGQLGLGDTSDQDEPTYVDALRGVGVRQIACGSGHTVVLTTDGEVYTWVSVIHALLFQKENKEILILVPLFVSSLGTW